MSLNNRLQMKEKVYKLTNKSIFNKFYKKKNYLKWETFVYILEK